jgi:hypothetical protein
MKMWRLDSFHFTENSLVPIPKDHTRNSSTFLYGCFSSYHEYNLNLTKFIHAT